MKKINLLLIAILASAMAFMTSCDPEPTTLKPTASITTSHSDAVMPGTTVKIAYSVVAEESIEKVSFLKNGSSYGTAVTKDFDTKTAHADTVIFENVETGFKFAVQVEDKQGQSQLAEVTITIQDVTVSSYTVTLGDTNDVEGSFIDLANGHIYTAATGDDYAFNNQAVIDLFYFHSSLASAAAFYSPETATTDYDLNTFANLSEWDTRMTTLFTLNNDVNYSTITYAELTDGLAGVTSQAVQELADGDQVFFKLDDERCGLIKVNTVLPLNDKTISFSFKLQDSPAK